ncbi:gliding motility-associated C-terminal domain-containing protein [Saccharicrinis aurantiacus]|uniref:gliding motility-associated C-terminal domain-containing protein n=1 Tax=Saccharicrinis aurantiacus TaxID=1849719 RepID=UPI000838368A|nr:gliding motility-associated C-terminal domain-containing protein [Saccharicrinis aurantiacus]
MKNNKNLFSLALLLVNCIALFSQPTAKIISNDVRLCESGTADIIIELTGQQPFDIDLRFLTNSGYVIQRAHIDQQVSEFTIPITFPYADEKAPLEYTVELIKITDRNGTTDITDEKVKVFVDDKSQITIGSTAIVCGRSFTTNSQSLSPNATYLWTCTTGTFDDPTKLNPTFTGTNTTTEESYTLVLESKNGACKDGNSVTQSMLLTLKGRPKGTITTEEDIICAPADRTVNLNFVGNGSYSYQLINTAGDTFDGTSNSDSKLETLTIMDNDKIQLYSLTDNSSGCQATASDLTGEKSFINETPNTSVGDYSTVCGEERSLILSGSDNTNTTGEWTTSTPGVVFENASLHNSSVSSDTYQEIDASWTETTENLGCVNSADTKILFSESPTLSLAKNKDQICENSSTILPLTLKGNGPWQVRYSDDSGKQYSEEIDTNNHNIIINGEDLSPGTFNYSFTDITGANGCITDLTDTTFNLVVDELPYPFAGEDQTVCGREVVLEASKPFVGVGLWQGKGTFIDQEDPNTTFTALNFGTQDLQWIIVNGACVAEDLVSINFLEAPYPVNAGSDTTIYVSTAMTLNALPLETGIGQWTVASGNSKIDDPNNPKSLISNLEKGQHILTWTGYIQNSEACESIEDEITIISKDIVAPSGISPNGDGFNDVLKLLGAENITNNKLSVFNQHGKLIYSATNYENDWNGIDNGGSKLSPGTYYYTFEGDQLKTPIKNYLIIKYD